MPQPTSDTRPKKPWYHEGLPFQCTQCGDCCTGAPGFVWVNNKEIAALAKLLEIDDVREFEQKYVYKVGARKSLRELAGGDCVFFDNQQRRCTVYAERPRQCRTWPFWSSNLKSKRAWEATCKVCPGSGQGKLHELQSIEQMRRVVGI